jgi:acetylornithine deacetylase/succinyl-diaminopimelate desuccinylase-like protein
MSFDRANEIGDPLVLTFGKVIPKPNTVNVVPGEVEFTIDCRIMTVTHWRSACMIGLPF